VSTDRPRLGQTSAFGLEVWITGTPAECNAAVAALHSAGRVAYIADRYPLAGADRGRFRTYALIHLTTDPASDPATGTTTA
jgi:hypothetical protein